MPNSTFNPDPKLPYGTCQDCEIELKTKEIASEHMRTTYKNSKSGRGHSITVKNPNRKEAIRTAVSLEVDLFSRNLTEIFSEFETWLTRDELTEDELLEAMRQSNTGVELEDSWKAWRSEEQW